MVKKCFSKCVALTAVMTLLVFSAGAVCAMEIGVAWVGKSGMAKRVAKGLQEGMVQLAPDVKMEFQKELGSLADLEKIVSRWSKEKQGMVILRSNGAKWLGKNPPQIPTFIGGCNNPEQLGAVKNMKAPEGNITGVTYYLPVATQFEIFQAIVPDMASVLLLLGHGNPSADVDRTETEAVCKKLGIAYNGVVCASVGEIEAAVNKYKSKVSAIIIGNQAEVMDYTQQIMAAAEKTPVVSYSNKPVKMGALGGFVADDVKLGGMLSESVVEVLKKGKAIKDVPVKVDPDPKFFVNVKTVEMLGIEIPYTILEAASLIDG
jgi:putative tryptophan/tyrosine transport system substrate-binding protein